MKTPKQVADELIEKYKFVYIPNYSSMFEVIQCAIIDTTGKVELLQQLYLDLNDEEVSAQSTGTIAKRLNELKEVLTDLKSR